MGKITLEVEQDESIAERLTFRILDTGEGVTLNEIDNLHFPYMNKRRRSLRQSANPLTFWLCNQLARKLGGHLNIKARNAGHALYRSYQMLHDQHTQVEERLLDDVSVMVDVTSNECSRDCAASVRKLGATPASRRMKGRGKSSKYDLFNG